MPLSVRSEKAGDKPPAPWKKDSCVVLFSDLDPSSYFSTIRQAVQLLQISISLYEVSSKPVIVLKHPALSSVNIIMVRG